MASEDRDSFPDGFAIPSPPKGKETNRKICLVCQAGRPCEPLRKGKECSVEKAIRAKLSIVVIRMCWLCLRIITSIPSILALELLCIIYKRTKYSVCIS